MRPSRWLLPFSILYQAAVQTRNRLYDIGVLTSHDVEAPVISVGNISVGGTGKTPFVIYLADRLRKLPVKVGKTAVVSRGYRGSATGTHVVSDGNKVISTPDMAGDEPMLIAESSPGRVVIVDRNRVRGTQYAIEELRARLILLDDGFQHRRLARNLDIVLLDSRNPLGNRRVLPAGFLREPVSSLARADLVVLSKARGDDDDLAERSKRLGEIIKKPVIVTRIVPQYWRSLGQGELLAADQIKGRKVVAFAGIADPTSFFSLVEELGAEIAGFVPLPDHCRYSKAQMDRIAGTFIRQRAEWLVTTSKDMIKLPAILRHLPVFHLQIDTEVVYGQELLDDKLAETVSNR